jgi:flagellar hook-length control protein FliK
MTTILDNIKTPDTATAINKGSLNANKEANRNVEFADLIEQENYKAKLEEKNKSLEKTRTNNSSVADKNEHHGSEKDLSKSSKSEDNSVVVGALLPEAQAKETLSADKAAALTESKNTNNSSELNLQKPLEINTGSGNKLPGEGHIQPLPPTQALSAAGTKRLLSEGFEFKNQQIQKELAANVELTKIVNLNPAKTAVNNASLTAAEIQAVTQKGPKQTIQPVNLGNLKLQSQSEATLLNAANDNLKPLSQAIQNTLISAEGMTKDNNLTAHKQQTDFQQVITSDLKLKAPIQLSQLIKTDAAVESTTTTTSNASTQQINSISPIANSLTPSAVISTDAKPITMTMQTTYSAANKEWSENFSRNIALMTMSRNNLAEIRMDPPDLGAIQVKISHTGTETNLQFQVSHNDTRQAIEASIQRLKESMAEQGFTNVNVDIQHGEQSENKQQQQNASLAKSNSSDLDENLQQQTSILQLQNLSSSGVDFFA